MAEPIALDGELVISDAFLPAERAEIDAAVAEWHRATGGSVRFALVRSPGDAPWRLERSVIDDCAGLGARGCARRARRLIELDPWRIYPVGAEGFDLHTWGDFRGITMHELGHAMGLQHGDGMLMRDDGEVAHCIDAGALDVLCSLRGCAEVRPTCD